MDFMDYIHKTVNAEVDAMCDSCGQWCLGQLLERLGQYDLSMPVVMDNGKSPGDYNSYRGYYRFVAIEPSDKPCTVGELAHRTKDAIGHTFEGYKGGEYVMTARTPVWYAYYGKTDPGTGIVGVEERGGQVVLITKDIEESDE